MYKLLFNKREVLVFRQFTRKGYALFACLGREVVISVLSVATLSAAKATSISAETWRADTTQVTKEVMLDDIGVMGSRAPLTKSQAARMVTVLSREDIQAAPVQSVNDLLKYAVGVDVRQRGALGSQTDISIRGGTQEQITVLLNGINICDPQTAHNVLDLPCQLSEIVRIEVLEGPAGRAYGCNSLVGAVNIVTNAFNLRGRRKEDGGRRSVLRGWWMEEGGRRSDLSSEVNLEGGSFGYAKAAFVANLSSLLLPPSTIHEKSPSIFLPPSTILENTISASYQRSDGYSRSKAGHLNTDYSGAKGFYQGCYDNDLIRLNWHLGIADKGWGSGTFYATPRWQADEQYEHTTKVFSAIQAETKRGAVYLRPAIYWNQNRDRYEGYRGQPDVMKYNYNRCNVFGANINSFFDWTLGRTAFGAEIRNEDLVSSNLGEPLSHPRHIRGTERDYTLGINRTNTSAHLEHNLLFDRLTVSTGFIAAKSSWSNADWKLYPGIDISYQLYGPNLTPHSSLLTPHSSLHTPHSFRLFASYNSSLRLPSFTEMYYKLQGYAANPHLKPEEMQAIEIGAQYVSTLLHAKTTLWHHRGRNMIDWMMDTTKGEQATWQSVNHTRLNATGFETDIKMDFRQLSSYPRTSAPSHPRITSLALSYSYITQSKKLQPGIVSQYALEYLRHKLTGNIQVGLWRQLELALHFRWQDRVGQYTTFSGEVCNYRPYALVDARMQWTAQHYQLYAEVNNLFDNRHYVDFGNVAQPGIFAITGIKIRI